MFTTGFFKRSTKKTLKRPAQSKAWYHLRLEPAKKMGQIRIAEDIAQS